MFPSRTLTRALVWVGAAVCVVTAGLFVRVLAVDLVGLGWSVPFLGAYVAGLIAVRRRPEHIAARRLLVLGAVATLWIGSSLGLAFAFDAQGQQWWLGPANVAVQFLGLAMGAASVALMTVFPDGAYGRYERRLVLALSSLAVVVPIGLLVSLPTLQPAWVFGWGDEPGAFPEIRSPVHVDMLSFLGVPARGYHEVAVALAPLICAVVVGLRYRRLPDNQRLQLRWPMYGALAVVVAPVAVLLHEVGAVPLAVRDVLIILGLASMPASVAIGLVRPDLFDVDRAMRRSLVYVPLWVAIAGVYIAVAAALGAAVSGLGLQVTIAVTILATVLFEPARRHLARSAARWAFGRSLSREELMQRLGQTLEHTLELDELIRAISCTARDGLGVRWVRIALDGPAGAIDGDVPEPEGEPTITAPLIHAGQQLGQIACGPRIGGRVSAADQELLHTLAGQAALAIHNARLAAQLAHSLDEIKAQAAELAASRSRIVAAHESARRQLERDIHDGAQQELVALIARIGLAINQQGRDSGGLEETLGELQDEARLALDHLRQLAAGIHSSVLSDHGLVEAIEGRSARLPLKVSIQCDQAVRTARFDDDIESAAYFLVSEALANTLKHARAEQACIRLARSDHQLEINVEDDGTGFDAIMVSGSGLTGLADRIEALGGTFTVVSSPGLGTRLTACLPIGGAHAV